MNREDIVEGLEKSIELLEEKLKTERELLKKSKEEEIRSRFVVLDEKTMLRLDKMMDTIIRLTSTSNAENNLDYIEESILEVMEHDDEYHIKYGDEDDDEE